MLLTLFINSYAQIEFVENKGQWPFDVLYSCKLNNGRLFIQQNAITWYFYQMPYSHPQSFPNHSNFKNDQPNNLGPQDPQFTSKLNAHAYQVVFENANLTSKTIGINPYSHVTNFIMSKDSSKWRSNVKSYDKVYIKNLYQGIDLEIFSSENQKIKYNFIVAPRTNIDDIQMKYLGLNSISLKNKKLQLKNSLFTLEENIPLTFYTDGEGETIPCDYVLKENTVSFKTPKSIYNRPIVIDPQLIFSSYSGSSADNWGFTATYDNLGCGYSAGIVFGTGFPTTLGAFQVNFGGGVDVDFSNGDVSRDIGILKYSPDGKNLIYATYIGGSHNEQPHSMVVNHVGELCVLGTTFSTNFPGIKISSFQSNLGGQSDIVIFKLNSSGSSIIAATYYGGLKRDGLNGLLNSSDQNTSPLGWNYGDMFRGEIICDNSDNLYIASSTETKTNEGLQMKNGEWLTYNGGNFDGVVAMFNSNLNSLFWSTYIGGSNIDASYGLNLYNNQLYVCGGTNSNDLKLKNLNTIPKFNQYQGGVADGYIIQLDASSGKSSSGTYIGTSGYDQTYFVQIDRYGKPYTYGQTNAGTWPITIPIYNNAGASQFIVKLDEKLTTYENSMTFGSGRKIPDISPCAFLVDKCGRIFVSGWGGKVNAYPRGNNGSTNGMPLTNNAFDKKTDGSDFYLGVFNRDMDTLLYGTFFGGHDIGSDGNPLAEHVDGGTSRFDYEGKVYQSVCGGCGGSSGFPTTPGAHSQTNNSTNCNNALFKIDFENLNYKPIGASKTIDVYAGDTIIYQYKVKDQDKKDSLYITRIGNVFASPLLPPYAEMNENTGIGEVSSEFKWLPLCQHISTDTYYVYIQTRDNNICPKPDTSYDEIKIVVKTPPVIKPPNVVCVEHIDDNTLKITWDKTDETKYFKYYLLFRKDPLGITKVIDTIYRNSNSEYIDDQTPFHQIKNFCYFILGVNICDKVGDTSYKACSADEYRNPIDSVYLFSASVVDNKFVQIKWFKSKEPDFGSYLLFKNSNKFKGPNIPVFIKSISNINDTIYNDSLVSVSDSSYCYTLRVTDKCGHISNYCNFGCTILLKGKSEPYIHNMFWNDYKEWEGGVNIYEIKRSDSIDFLFTYVDKTNNITLNYADTSMFYDWGLYTYKIIAKEGYKGYNATSESNWISLYQEPLLWVPDAFTPNGDNINDNWGWQSVFVKTMHMSVYNRWGELVFETDNKKDFWDGIYNNKRFDNNVYVWHAEYTGWDNSKHSLTGNVTVLK